MNFKILITLVSLIGIIGLVSATAPVAHFYGNVTTPTPPAAGSYVYCYNGAYPEWDLSDEGAELQACIDYARDNDYDGILLPASQTVIINQQINLWDNLECVGNESTIKLKDNSALHGTSGTMWRMKPGSWTHNLTIDGNREGGNDAQINGLGMNNNTLLENSTIKNVQSYAVSVYMGTNVMIRNNYINNTVQYSVNTGGSDGAYSWGYNVTVKNNTINNSASVGIKIRGTDVGLITNNTITMVRGMTGGTPTYWSRGISLYSYDEENHFVTISNNTIHGYVGGSWPDYTDCISSDDELNYDIDIHDNTVDHCRTGIDIWFDDGLIHDNTITSSTYCVTDNGAGNSVYDNTCG